MCVFDYAIVYFCYIKEKGGIEREGEIDTRQREKVNETKEIKKRIVSINSLSSLIA